MEKLACKPASCVESMEALLAEIEEHEALSACRE
jgi:hypothetical protein